MLLELFPRQILHNVSVFIGPSRRYELEPESRLLKVSWSGYIKAKAVLKFGLYLSR